jgi:hypothetical protein
MFHFSAPGVIVFSIFTLVSGGLAFYCGWVIQRHRRKLRQVESPAWQISYSRFTLAIMALPFLAFTFGFLCFGFLAFRALLSLILR